MLDVEVKENGAENELLVFFLSRVDLKNCDCGCEGECKCKCQDKQLDKDGEWPAAIGSGNKEMVKRAT